MSVRSKYPSAIGDRTRGDGLMASDVSQFDDYSMKSRNPLSRNLPRQWHAACLDFDMRRDGAAPLIGSSAVMRTVRERVGRVAATDFTVLIEGESGTGKELVARQIHEISARRRGPFVAVNCAALVETLLEAELFGIEDRTATGVRGRRGKFECANTGTLFLDEVADLSPSAQAKLLRAIQDLAVERVGGNGVHHVNIRVVAATNKKLSVLVKDRMFRADLFYRLAGIEVHVPPLARSPGRHPRAGVVLPGAPQPFPAARTIAAGRRRAIDVRLAG